MSRNVLIYAGGFGLPDGNASANRVISNAHLFRAVGFEVVMLGKFYPKPGVDQADRECWFNFEGFDCYNIERPDRERKYTTYVTSVDPVERVMDIVGRDRIFGFIGYNYPGEGLGKVHQFCQKNEIITMVDATEWYGLDSYSPLDLLRFAKHEYRMRVLQKRIGNIICISRLLRDYYKGCNTVIIPNMVNTAAPKWHTPIPERKPGPRRFIYAGNPGKGMHKEFVHWMIDAFLQCKNEGLKFLFSIVGMTEKQLLETFPDYAGKIKEMGDQIEFLGRLKHVESLEQVRQSDFFVFLRPKTRANQAGCPTKLTEAFGCGVPTISNASGDVEVYLSNPEHGFLFPDPDRDQLAEAIRNALKVDDARLARMKASVLSENPFRRELFEGKAREFMDRAYANSGFRWKRD